MLSRLDFKPVFDYLDYMWGDDIRSLQKNNFTGSDKGMFLTGLPGLFCTLSKQQYNVLVILCVTYQPCMTCIQCLRTSACWLLQEAGKLSGEIRRYSKLWRLGQKKVPKRVMNQTNKLFIIYEYWCKVVGFATSYDLN